jgi:hypothetical protein
VLPLVEVKFGAIKRALAETTGGAWLMLLKMLLTQLLNLV